MNDPTSIIHSRIIENVSEGIILIGFNGKVMYANPRAMGILGLSAEDLIGKKFATVFFDDPENDEFTQAVLECVYDKSTKDSIVKYTVGGKVSTLRMITSFYTDGNQRTGVIAVFSDISELEELRDAVKSMHRIQSLNSQLELRNKLLNETFGRFLSDEIVKNLLDNPDGMKLGGESRTLTIMMSDLRGFTALSERMDPGDLITLLNHYLMEMTDAIQSNSGTIIEFIGDGILAIFGAPDYFEDNATKAVVAALTMQEKMKNINKWNDEHGYPFLEMGIGINTGEVIVGNIGSEKRTKYGVVGKEVNLCGRIESYTVGGQILIPPSTRDAVGEELEIVKEMVVYPKGAKGELLLSQVVGIGGPYNIHVEQESEKPQLLKKPAPVCFFKLDGEHRLEGTNYGGITAVAHDRAILETATELEALDNIEMEAGGDLYCKVLEEKDNGYLLQYTAVPAGYDNWLKSISG